MNNPRIVEVRTKILKDNDRVARELRDRFARAGVFVVSMVSSPGAGKTALLQKTLSAVRDRWKVAALVGDLATDNDARRLAESGVPVRQIETGTICHLEAAMVENALSDWSVDDLDVLFIENVGNMVCPASFDLGERLRLVLMSTTEGEDKPLKYPTIFNTADAAIITKMDLATAVGFDKAAAEAAILQVRPGMTILHASSSQQRHAESIGRNGAPEPVATGEDSFDNHAGLREWLDYLVEQKASFDKSRHQALAAIAGESHVMKA